jgi:hypothetical protein
MVEFVRRPAQTARVRRLANVASGSNSGVHKADAESLNCSGDFGFRSPLPENLARRSPRSSASQRRDGRSIDFTRVDRAGPFIVSAARVMTIAPGSWLLRRSVNRHRYHPGLHMVLNGLLARGAFWSRTTPRPLANTYGRGTTARASDTFASRKCHCSRSPSSTWRRGRLDSRVQRSRRIRR